MKYLLKIIFILFLFSLLGSVQAQTNPKQSLSTILQPLAKKPVPYDALIRNLQAFQGTISGNKPGEKALRNQVRFWEYEITYRKLLSQTNPAPTAKDFKRLYDDFHSIPTANVGNKILKSWIEYKLGFCQFRLAELATDGNRAIVHYEKAAIHFNAIVPKENELYFPARVMRGICFIRKALVEKFAYDDKSVKKAKSDLAKAEKVFRILPAQRPDSIMSAILLANSLYEEGSVNLLSGDKGAARKFWDQASNLFDKINQEETLSSEERKRIDYLMKMARLRLYSLDLKLGDLKSSVQDYEKLLETPYIPNFGPEAQYRNTIDLPFILSMSYSIRLTEFGSFKGDYAESSFWRGLYSFITENTTRSKKELNRFIEHDFGDLRRNILINLSRYYLALIYFDDDQFQKAIDQISTIFAERIKTIVSQNKILALSLTSEFIRSDNPSRWENIFLQKTSNLNGQDKTILLLKIVHTLLTKYSLTNDPKYYDQLNSFIPKLKNNSSFAFLDIKAENALEYLLAVASIVRMRPYVNLRGTINLQRAESAYRDAMNKLSSISSQDKNLWGEINYLRAYATYRMAQTYFVNQKDSYREFIKKSISDFTQAFRLNHNYRVLTRLGNLLIDPTLFPQQQFHKQALICFKNVYDFFEQNPQFDRTDYFFDTAQANLGNFKSKAHSFKINYEGSTFSLDIGSLDYKSSLPLVAGERISYDQIIDKDVRKKQKKQTALKIWQFYALPELNIYPSVYKTKSQIRNFNSTRLAGFIDEFQSLKVKVPIEVFYDTNTFGNVEIKLTAHVIHKNTSYLINFKKEKKGNIVCFRGKTPEFSSGQKIKFVITYPPDKIYYFFSKNLTLNFFPDTLRYELTRRRKFDLQPLDKKTYKEVVSVFDSLREKKYDQLKKCLNEISEVKDSLTYAIKPYLGKSLINSVYYDLSKYPLEGSTKVVPVDILCDRNNRIYLLDWKRSKVVVADKFGKVIREFGSFSARDTNQIGHMIKLTYPLRFEILEPDKKHPFESTFLLIADYYGIKISDLDGNYLGKILKTNNPKYNGIFPFGSIGRIISKGYGVNTVLYLLNRFNQSVYQFKAKEQK